ncbi:hypothetical protein MNBD_ALPHA11-1047 [hydrothermal vent metagenome]|uniref:Uncharacterized protein n=1 Tax=hydrothermal vent metagenome TaxID=652676 RepID=A0A3B0U4F9_9ZZZZ
MLANHWHGVSPIRILAASLTLYCRFFFSIALNSAKITNILELSSNETCHR